MLWVTLILGQQCCDWPVTMTWMWGFRKTLSVPIRSRRESGDLSPPFLFHFLLLIAIRMSFLHLIQALLCMKLFSVMSALGCHNEIPLAEHNRNLFQAVLEGGSPKSECVYSVVWWGLSSWLGRRPPSCHVLIWQSEEEKTQAFTRVSACKDTNLMDQGPTPMTSFNRNSIKLLFPNTVTLGGRASTYGFERTHPVHRHLALISSCHNLSLSTHPPAPAVP